MALVATPAPLHFVRPPDKGNQSLQKAGEVLLCQFGLETF